MQQFTFNSKEQQRERGMTLPLLAVFIFTLFIIAALAVDLGIAYTARTSAQHAADAAALAGAFTFQAVAASQPDTAQNAAIAVAGQNKVLGRVIDTASFGKNSGTCPTDNTTSWVCVQTTKNRVTVNVARTNATSPIGTFFARVFGITSLEVATIATAEGSSGVRCLKPFFIANTAINQPARAPNPITNPSAALAFACSGAGGPYTFFDPTCNPAPGTNPNCAATTYAVGSDFKSGQLGQQLTFWNDNNVGQVPSQWGELKFSQTSTGPTLTCSIENCLNQCSGVTQSYTCGSSITTNQGAKVGPIQTPLVNLTSAPNTWTGLSNLDPNSPAIITMAVYQDCPSNIVNPGFGNVTIIGYIDVFVAAIGGSSTKTVTSYLTNVTQCGTPANAGGATTVMPVRLIQPGET